MTYSNTVIPTAQSTVYSGQVNIAPYSTITLQAGIPHTAQLTVERRFTTALAGSANTLVEFLSSPNVSAFHRRQIFTVPNDRVTFNSATNTVTNLRLPSTGDVYIYTAGGLSVSVPPLTNGQTVTVSRKTISNVPLVTWVPGTKLTTVQLNAALTQSLFLTQEILSIIDRKIAFVEEALYNIGDDAVTAAAIADGAVHANHITTDSQVWSLTGTVTLPSATASSALFTNANKVVTSTATTGTGSVVLANGASLGTPASLVGTNITGTAIGLTAGHATTVSSIPTLAGDVTNVGNTVTVTGFSGPHGLTLLNGIDVGTTLEVGGAATIDGSTLIKGNLTVLGGITGGSTTTSQQVSVDELFYIGTSPCSFTGDISGTTLTVTGIAGNLSVGSTLTWTGQTTFNPTITAFLGGTGGNGTYTVSPSGTQASIAMAGQGRTDALADGGGIELMATTNRSIRWYDTNDEWIVSDHLKLASGKLLRLGTSSIGYSSGTLAFTLPITGAGSLVSTASIDTLTNKTINSAASGANTIQIDGVDATTNTGTGAVVRATDATLVNPTFTNGAQLGTPDSGTLTNCTGLPVNAGLLGHNRPIIESPSTTYTPDTGLFPGVGAFLMNSTAANLREAVTRYVDVDNVGTTGTGALVFAVGPGIDLSQCIIPMGNATGQLIVAHGGTGLDQFAGADDSAAIGALVKATGRFSATTLNRGTTGQVLTSTAGDIAWQTPSISTLTSAVTTLTATPISAVGTASQVIPLSGAVVGDVLALGFSSTQSQYLKYHVWVSSPNNVTIQWYNIHTTQSQSPQGTLKVKVIR